MKAIFTCALLATMVGCHKPAPAVTPATHVQQPNSFDVTVSVERCTETSHQPDPDSGLVSLICLSTAGDGYCGVVMNAQEWSAMKFLAQYHQNGGL
jgi:predicted naringenin-chalcone synthase